MLKIICAAVVFACLVILALIALHQPRRAQRVVEMSLVAALAVLSAAAFTI